jgi:hypothetical protein
MDGIGWYRSPGAATAHAFVNGPGWTRSLCLASTWTVRLVRAGALFGDEPWLCRECCAEIHARRPGSPAMTEPEAREAFGK